MRTFAFVLAAWFVTSPLLAADFGVKAEQFSRAFNEDPVAKGLGISLRIASRERTLDGKGTVLGFAFNACPEGIGSADNETGNLRSFRVTASRACFEKNWLYVIYTYRVAVRLLTSAKGQEEAGDAVSAVIEAMRNGKAGERGVRTGVLNVGGRKLQFMVSSVLDGAAFSVLPE